MITLELPTRLQQELESSTRLLYDDDGVTRSLIEAVELWLAQQRNRLFETERTANDQAYETLKAELERQHGGKWIVIAHGALQGVADSLEEVDSLDPTAYDRIVMRVGEVRPQEVELGWQTTFFRGQYPLSHWQSLPTAFAGVAGWPR